MADFLIYLIKGAALLTVFYIFYRLLLSKETFHRFNRVVLLVTTGLSFILPLCVFTIERVITLPAQEGSGVADPVNIDAVVNRDLGLDYIFISIFIVGLLIVLSRIIFSTYSVLAIIKRSERVVCQNEEIYISSKDISPFSWMSYIVIPKADYNAQDYAPIIAHERAHIKMRHSWDLLFIDIISLFQWFNPIIWMLKQDIRALHEYEADNNVLKNGINAKQYQYLLIKKAIGKSGYSVANSFSHSTLKNRITMMLKSNSNWKRALKALYIIPIMGFSLYATAQTKVTVKDTLQTDGKVKTIILDGKRVSQLEIDKINPDDIAKMRVLKGTAALETFGVDGKDGVLIITTKKFASKIDDMNQGTIRLRVADKGASSKNRPLIIVDGVKVVESDFNLNEMDPKTIDNISVLKDAKAIEKYGDDGKNGVIIINTKKKIESK